MPFVTARQLAQEQSRQPQPPASLLGDRHSPRYQRPQLAQEQTRRPQPPSQASNVRLGQSGTGSTQHSSGSVRHGSGKGGQCASKGGRQSILKFASASQCAPQPTVVIDVEEDTCSISEDAIPLRTLLVGRQFHSSGNQDLLERAQDLPTATTAAQAQKRLDAAKEGPLLTLCVEREPSNRHDPCALLVRTGLDISCQPCGHLPKEHAVVLSPLLDNSKVTIVSANVEARKVIELSVAGLRALPLMLHVRLHPQVSPKEAVSVHSQLQALPAVSSVAPTTRASKRRVDDELRHVQQPRKPVQRSLLANFGRGLTFEMPCLQDGGMMSARVFSIPSFLPELANHLGMVALLCLRWTCTEHRKSVDGLRHTRSRAAVEQLVTSPMGDIAANAAATAAIASVVPETAISAGPFNLSRAVRAIAEWAPSNIPFEAVKDAVSSVIGMPCWAALERSSGMEFSQMGHVGGWPAFAAALCTAASSARLPLLRAALRCIPFNELREMVALLVLLSAPLLQVAAAFSGEASEPVLTWGLQRLHRDLLGCNRLLEDAGLKLSVAGLHMPGLRLTEEQSQIVVKPLAANELLLISAFAGTGKTSTLRMYALLRPHLRILYLCFNVSVREEAERCFPSNVTCRNMHQLAFAACGYRFRHKLAGDDLKAEDMVTSSVFDAFLRGPHISSPTKDAGADMQHLESVEACLSTLKGFLNSADAELSEKHLPNPLPDIINAGHVSKESVVEMATELWRRMCDPGDMDVKMTHAGYLKVYSLSGPKLKYDAVMLDEAQDCNPAIGGVVISQACARILVGDEHQAIYGFLGAQDMLGNQRVRAWQGAGNVIRRQLTRSFRFGQHVADLANFMLRSFAGEARPLLGCGSHEGDLLPPSREWPAPPFAFIARTNTSVLMQALRADETGLSLEWVGGVKGYRLGLLQDLCMLDLGRRDEVESRRILPFRSVGAVKSFAKRVEDRELEQRAELVLRSNSEELLRRLQRLQLLAERREKAKTPFEADVSVSTVHKAKGLEWDTVVVADDFLDMEEEIASAGPTGWAGDVQELNMLYVALTRCKKRLQLPKSLASVYMPHAEAVAFAALPDCAGSCIACGDPLRHAARGSHIRLVGSVSCKELCGRCSGDGLRHFCSALGSQQAA